MLDSPNNTEEPRSGETSAGEKQLPPPEAPAPAQSHSASDQGFEPEDGEHVVTENSNDPPLPEEEPPLPDEQPPPLPAEAPPASAEGAATDDGWAPIWDDRAQAYYFFNNITNVSQWENPRVPDATPTTTSGTHAVTAPTSGGYNPAIHGDYDPNADYAKTGQETQHTQGDATQAVNPMDAYAATGAFNRFTGKWQNAELTTERFSDESKSKRQMNAFFDVDAAANSHDGRSLRAERQNKKLSKKELQAFKDKRREKKEEKRRAWLRD